MSDYLNKIKKDYKDIPDLIIKKYNKSFFHEIYIIFLETLISQDRLNDYILKKIVSNHKMKKIDEYFPSGNIKKLNNYDDIEYYLFNGFAIIIDKNDIYAIEIKADITRSVNTNETEGSIKGPKNAFVENIQTNIGLIKRRIKSNKLKTIYLRIGNISKTNVNLLYINNIADEKIVNDIYNTLKKINIDIINDTENLTNYLSSKSIFPTVVNTERPDRCADALCEGKVVILCDESPNALILPAFLVDFINPYTDVYHKKINISFTKFIRILCFFLSCMIPAFYISIINYNQETIPTSLIINFAMQRESVPFPAVIECLIMLIICEILRESDLRFPSKYGSAISILGALVLGDAAVSAGLVTPIMIIITAFTYISSLIFSDPEIGNALRYYRFIFLFLSAIFGLYGFLVCFIFFIINLSSTTNYDNYYTFPLSPFDKSYFKKLFFALNNHFRSKYLTKNIRKEKQ